MPNFITEIHEVGVQLSDWVSSALPLCVRQYDTVMYTCCRETVAHATFSPKWHWVNLSGRGFSWGRLGEHGRRVCTKSWPCREKIFCRTGGGGGGGGWRGLGGGGGTCRRQKLAGPAAKPLSPPASPPPSRHPSPPPAHTDFCPRSV